MMGFDTPEIISIAAIIISLIMGVCGFITTAFYTLICFIIKGILNSIQKDINSVSNDVEKLSEDFKALTEKKDEEHHLIHRRITATDDKVNTAVKDFTEGIGEIKKTIGRLEGMISKKIIIGASDTHGK